MVLTVFRAQCIRRRLLQCGPSVARTPIALLMSGLLILTARK